MTLKTQISNDNVCFINLSEFAEGVTYTSKGGSAVIISVIVNSGFPLQEEYVRGTEFASCEIVLQNIDAPDLQYGDMFEIGGYSWGFDPESGIIEKTDDINTIRLERQF